MTEYEVIDAICDSVNPILLLLASAIAIAMLAKRDYKKAALVCLLLAAGLFLVYGLMLADARLGFWQAFAADYSTHTAFAIAVSIAISMGMPWGRWLVPVLILYGVAMWYQQYHSLLDILSTAIVVGGPLLLLRKYCVALGAQPVADSDT